MKWIILILSCLSALAQHPLMTGSGIDWTRASAATFSGDAIFATIPNLYIELFGNSTTNFVNSTNTWLDLSGKTNDFVQGTGNVPPYSLSGPNGFYAVDFGTNAVGAGTAQYLYCKFDITTNVPNTFFFVATEACSTGTNYLFDSKSTSINKNYIGLSTSTAKVSAGDEVALPSFNNNSNWMILSAVFNGVNSAVRKNGSNIKILPGIGAGGQEQMQIGNSQAANRPYTGKIAAVLAYGRALPTNELYTVEQQLNLKYALGLTITSNGFDHGTIWAERVVTNGGAYPSDFTKVAVTACLEGMITDGTYNSVGSMLLYPTDNLVAATSPVTGLFGNSTSPTLAADPWVNHNFVSGDLSASGFTGNATTKYLDTGVNPSTMMTINSTALFSYLITTNTASGEDLNAQIVGNANTIMLSSSLLGTTYSDQYNSTAGQGRQSLTSKGPGYYCGTRTDATHHNIYFAKTGTAHASIASSATTGGSFPNFNIFAHALNNGGTPLFWSDSKYGAMGIAVGLTANQSSNIYNRIVTFRTSMGGTNP